MTRHGKLEIRADFRAECDLDGFIGSLMTSRYQAQIDRLAASYERLHPSATPVKSGDGIPKILHQVWVGSKPIPQRYRDFMQGWRRQYPDWEYRLWTDSEVKNLDLQCAEIIGASECMGQKSDLLRVEILNQCGGLYVDCDYETLRPLGDIHDRYDFYGTLRAIPLLYLGSPKTYPGPLLICNSMIGARKGHPILSTYLNKVKALSERPELFDLEWHQRYSLARLRFSLDQIKRIKQTTLMTYIPFQEAVLAHLDSGHDRNILFPPTYFNPIDFWYPYRFVIWRYWMKRCQYTVMKQRLRVHTYEKAQPQTFTIHHSQASWL